MSEQATCGPSRLAVSIEAAARAVPTHRPSAGRSQSPESNASLIRLTEIVARIAERVERRANKEAASKAA